MQTFMESPQKRRLFQEEEEPPLRQKPRFPRRRTFESGTSAFADYFFLPFLTKTLQKSVALETSLLTAVAGAPVLILSVLWSLENEKFLFCMTLK